MSLCELCYHPLPEGEEELRYHGTCPEPPIYGSPLANARMGEARGVSPQFVHESVKAALLADAESASMEELEAAAYVLDRLDPREKRDPEREELSVLERLRDLEAANVRDHAYLEATAGEVQRIERLLDARERDVENVMARNRELEMGLTALEDKLKTVKERQVEAATRDGNLAQRIWETEEAVAAAASRFTEADKVAFSLTQRIADVEDRVSKLEDGLEGKLGMLELELGRLTKLLG